MLYFAIYSLSGLQVTARHVKLLKSARVGRKIAQNAVYRGLGAAFLAIIRPTLAEFKSLTCLSVTCGPRHHLR